MAWRTGVARYLSGLMGVHEDSSGTVATDVDRMGRRTLLIRATDGATATTNVALEYHQRVDTNITVRSVYWNPATAVSNNATNYATFGVFSGNGTAAATTAIANISTAATNIAAATPLALTLQTANLNVDAGETIAASILKAGAGGVAVGTGTLQINYVER